MMNKIKQEVLNHIDKYIIPELEKHGFDSDIEIMKNYKKIISFSKHYSLPDGGRLMEITDFNVPLKNGFVLPKNSVTFDYVDDYGAQVFVLCASMKAGEIPLRDNGFISAVTESGSDIVTMIVQFAFGDDFCGVNPLVAVVGNKCITSEDDMEFFPVIMMEQIATTVNIDNCSADIVDDVFCAYELCLALSCDNDVTINKNSKKGFVRNINGQNIWDDGILNVSLGVN